MPNISNIPKKKKKTKTKKTNLPAKTKLTKSTHDYYCCCAEKTKQGIPKGTKITQLTQHCKQNASKVMLAKQAHREQEKKKILEHGQQIGLSLGKIIDHS
jgi:hypothetical protein